ncbi:MAG: choice-of-anchor D domain-containing protein [candidate division KSB1 bacterium]|nr:choice-of-anchor D domain-containing protein [candidate division KSB1 bacterium]
MKRSLIFFALIAFSAWNAPAWAQKPKLDEMTFRIDGKTVTCTTGEVRVAVTMVFNIAMRDSIPKVTFGLAPPYAMPLPFITKTWTDNKTFVASFDINNRVPSTADGLYKFLIRKAYSAAGDTLTPVLSDTVKNGSNQLSTLYISRQGKLTANTNKVDFGTIKAGASFDKTLTVKNVTCADIFITRFTLSDPFILLDAPIGARISADASLTLKLRLSSLTRKTHAGMIKINFTSNQQQDSLLVQLAGVTRGPEMVFVPTPSLNFGTVVVGDSSTKTFRVTNREAADETLTDTLKIFSAVLNPAVGYTLSSPGSFIAPGDTKTVSIKFKPVEGKAYNSSLDFTTNDLIKPLGKISFPVTGTGQLKTPPPRVDTLLVTWPGGRVGYTNTDFLTICLNVNVADVQDARWKFWPTPVPPISPNDTTGTARFSVLNGKPCFKIPLRNVLSAGRWYCYIWLQGKNGVSGYQTPNYSQLYYDVAAPVFTKVPSVTAGWTGGFTGYTNADNLTVCWEASDSSGISEVRWKFTTARVKPQSPDDTTRFGGVLRQSGVRCATIPLKLKGLTEGRWYCYLWLVDGSGNSSYLNAHELPLIYDVTAPDPPGEPITRSIPRNDWFNTRRNPLTLTLALANGIRDAARVRWKFQTKPQAATLQDGESALERTNNNLRFSVYFNSPGLCGEDSLFYWLADSAGNAKPVNHSFAVYKFDMCAPVITRWRSGEPIAGKRTAFSDTVKIFDHTKIMWDSVLYRFGGARANEPPRRLRRVPNTKDLFVMDIPADGVTTRGLEYKVFARDSLNNPYSVGPATSSLGSVCGDDGNWQPVRVRTGADGEFRIDKDGNPVAQPSGKDQSSYTLYSVPFELDKNAPKDVLEDDLGAYDRSKWRLFEYRPEMAPNGWVEYNSTAPTISPFMPGRAFFMIVADADKVIDSGVGKTVSTGKRYAIELKKGWNLFSNPFNFPVSRENLTLVNSSIPQDSTRLSIRSYERGWNIDNIIEPWKGYAIYVEPRRPTEKIQLLVCPIATTPRIGKDAAPAVTSEKDWAIQIAATAGTARDTINWVGARSAAAEEYDDFDLVEPPVIGEYVSVYIPNLDWPLHPMKYTADFRPANQEIYEWPLQVNSNSPSGEVVLEFKGLANLPNDYDAYLVDQAYGMARNLKHNPSYRIVTAAAGVDKSLKLLVGKPEALRKQSNGLALVPKAFELSQNFPNPFAAKQAQAFTAIRYALPKSATVTVEVYNMLGQKVRTLVNRQIQAADYYLATWNGRDEAGKEVSSGIYLYRILAESEGERFTSTKKLLLVK